MTTPRAGPIGVALIGYGATAEMHAEALRAAGGTIMAVAGPDASRVVAFADRHAIPGAVGDSLAAMDGPGVDAVVITSPTHAHAAQAQSALEAGRHVLVEIPLATSLAEGEGLVALASRVGRTLAVCHTLRYWEPIRTAHRWLAERGIRPTHVVARALSRRHTNVGWTGRQRSWTDDLLWHHGGHVLDEVLTLLDGPVADVQAMPGPMWPGSGRPMDHAISLRTRDGAIASVALSYHAHIGASDYVVISEPETLVIAGTEVRAASGVVVPAGDPMEVHRAAVFAQDADFLDAIRAGRPTAADATSVLPTLAVCQAVQDLGAGL